MKTLLSIILISAGVFLVSCEESNFTGSGESASNNDSSSSDNNSTWSIPENEVVDGGPGKDGIPSIDNPQFISVDQVDFLEEKDLVLGLKIGSEIKAYPHPILDWHEIVNDEAGNSKVAITYCPLTGTGIGWNRKLNNKTTTFGVSGLLYNSNLIPYDRETDSYWSQMLMESVNGAMKGTEVSTYQVIETSWETWKKMYPGSEILSTNTGYNRNYDRYPYGDYRTSSGILFPVNPEDNRLFEKERVLGIISNDDAKVYRFQSFEDSTRIIKDNFAGKDYLIVGSNDDNLLIAFNIEDQVPSGEELNMRPVQNSFPIIMEDSTGSKWNIFGEAISGPNEGKKLKKANSYIGFWFTWGAFFPEPKIYKK